MADVVNLNRARKAKAKVDRERQAAANRAAFGRTKAEKAKDAAERRRREETLDATKRE
jgi:hypothetical protein